MECDSCFLSLLYSRLFLSRRNVRKKYVCDVVREIRWRLYFEQKKRVTETLRDDSFADRVQHNLGGIMKIQLLHNPSPVSLDCVRAQIQQIGHLLVEAGACDPLTGCSRLPD